jgi:hypothetical protein
MVKDKAGGVDAKPISTVAEVMAVRACIDGVANADQQKLCMNWIGREAARVADGSYRPGEQPLATAFNEGRRYVGILIRYMLLPDTLAAAKQHDKEQEAKR